MIDKSNEYGILIADSKEADFLSISRAQSRFRKTTVFLLSTEMCPFLLEDVMNKSSDLSGKRFGRLVVKKRVKSKNTHNSSWECLCDCGNTTIVTRPNLISNHTKSCSCLRRDLRIKRNITHGKSNSMAYKKWIDMKTRCNNVNATSFKNYGGRGIKISKRWNKFENFYKDMGNPPRNCTLERIDNNKGYSKNNCKWATTKEQSNNRRDNILLTYLGKTHSLEQWSEKMGLSYSTIRHRLKSGWSIQEALTIPISRHTSIKKIRRNKI